MLGMEAVWPRELSVVYGLWIQIFLDEISGYF